jgi:hypothetical protein
MNEPNLEKLPTEIFGHPYTANSAKAKDDLQNQFCPFLQGECKKPRKSEPHIKVGICSVGYKGNYLDNAMPVIVCPHRFLTDYIFQTVQEKYFPEWQNVKWVSEVNIGGGNVDFVAVEIVGEQIKDFICIELQASGTTGSAWQGVLDTKKHGKFQSEKYVVGINWKNEFVKTMMQQVFHKGQVVALWKRKIVFVIQDGGLEYMQKTCDTSRLREKNDADPIHFCIVSLVWKETFWDFQLSQTLSTDIEGASKIIGGNLEEKYPTEETFKERIKKKLKR